MSDTPTSPTEDGAARAAEDEPTGPLVAGVAVVVDPASASPLPARRSKAGQRRRAKRSARAATPADPASATGEPARRGPSDAPEPADLDRRAPGGEPEDDHAGTTSVAPHNDARTGTDTPVAPTDDADTGTEQLGGTRVVEAGGVPASNDARVSATPNIFGDVAPMRTTPRSGGAWDLGSAPTTTGLDERPDPDRDPTLGTWGPSDHPTGGREARAVRHHTGQLRAPRLHTRILDGLARLVRRLVALWIPAAVLVAVIYWSVLTFITG
ncbi:MAG: hypothetical protein AAFN30_04435 [Actinomycetota bacterium]